MAESYALHRFGTRGPNERKYAHPDELVEDIRIAPQQVYRLAREQLRTAAECKKKNCHMRVPVGLWVLHCSPPYVGRSPKWRRNYSGTCFAVMMH